MLHILTAAVFQFISFYNVSNTELSAVSGSSGWGSSDVAVSGSSGWGSSDVFASGRGSWSGNDIC